MYTGMYIRVWCVCVHVHVCMHDVCVFACMCDVFVCVCACVWCVYMLFVHVCGTCTNSHSAQSQTAYHFPDAASLQTDTTQRSTKEARESPGQDLLPSDL